MSALRSLLVPLALLTGMSGHPQGLLKHDMKQELTLTVTNRSARTGRTYQALAFAPSRNPELPRPTVTRLALKVGDSPTDFMAVDVHPDESKTVTLVVEYPWVSGQTVLDLGLQLKDDRGDTVLWAFDTDGPKVTAKVVASEFSGQRVLNPKAVSIDGSTLTIKGDHLGR